MDLEGLVAVGIAGAPEPVEDRAAGQDAAGVLHEQLEQVEFAAGEVGAAAGGVDLAAVDVEVDVADPDSEVAINDDVLQEVRLLLRNGREFVRQVYLPDLFLIAGVYDEWGGIGRGLGDFLTFGDFSPAPPQRSRPPADGLFPGGLVRGADLSTAAPFDPAKVAEYVTHSWYAYDGGDDKPLTPWEGETRPDYTGPEPPYEHLDVAGKYSWLKSPRYDDLAVEVGPLARIVIGYAHGDRRIRGLVDGALKKLGAKPDVLFSTLGRTLARGLETSLLADHSLDLLDRLQNAIAGGDLRIHDGSGWDPGGWPKSARGVGFHEAPRGGLPHWVVIEDQKISRYQAVVPSTWNAGPRDAAGKRGAYESALLGTPVADPTRPLEILRTVHSFDPCMACAAHILDADGAPVVEVRVQ